MRSTRAREVTLTELSGFEPVGTVEMRLNRFAHSHIHEAIDQVARAAAEIGGDHFAVVESLGNRIVAVACRRPR